MEKISVFQCLDKSSKPINEFTIDEALGFIKDHPKKHLILECKNDPVNGGKKNLNLIYNDRVWNRSVSKLDYVKRNFYNHVKQQESYVVTWNCFVEEKRTKDKIQAPSGYIYFDIDDFTKISEVKNFTSSEQAKTYIKNLLSSENLKFVKAAWDSFSGEGLGFLVKVEGLSLENFSTTWKAISNLFSGWNINIDPQTKDITRCNVLPYDPNIFVREESEIIPFDAVQPKENIYTPIVTDGLPLELASDVLAYQLHSLYHKPGSWSNNHISYKFFFDYFVFCNQMGIDLNESLNYLILNQEKYPKIFKHRSVEEVRYGILNNIEKYYGHQFGVRAVKNEEGHEIYGLYKKYDGDIKLKLDYIWFNIKEKSGDDNKKIYRMAILAKEAGITKKPVIDYLESVLNFNDNLYPTIDKIYGNSDYLFGCVKVLSEEGKSKKLESYKSWAVTNGYRVVIKYKFEGKLEKTLENILETAANIYHTISYDNVFSYIGYYFKQTKGHAIIKETAYTFLNEIIEYSFEDFIKIDNNITYSEKKHFISNLIPIIKFLADECYTQDSWKFGVRIFRNITPQEIRSRYKITKEYFLKPGQYINEINIPDEDNQIIWGNTGQGKTTWICEHIKGKRLILVPIIPLLLSIDNSYNASVYYRDKKNVQEGDELIVCTYSSFPNLLKQMKNWENVKISDYALYVDEEHNNAVSSSPEFRGYELNYIVDNMHLFRKRMFLTGTKIPVLHPAFKNFDIIRVNWEKTPIKYCTPVRYNNILFAIEKNLSRNGKNLIYLQNKKEEGKMGELIDYLVMKGWKKDRIVCINADEKNSEDFTILTTKELIRDNVDIVICTSVIVEGVNIYNNDFKSVHFMTAESATNMEQMVNRLRNIFTKSVENNSMIYVYKPLDSEDMSETDHIDIVNLQENYIKNANIGKELFNKAYVTGDSVSYKSAIKVFNQQLFGKSKLYRVRDGVWEIDYLSIANMAYIEEKRYANKNFEFMKVLLHEYNWQFKEEMFVLEEIHPEEQSNLKTLKSERKEMLVQDVLKILEEIKIEGEVECCNKVKDDVVFNLESLPRAQYQVKLRTKIKYLCNSLSFEDSCELVEKWIKEHNMSDRIWSKIVRQINVQITKKINAFSKAVDNSSEIAKHLIKFYKKNREKEKATGSFVLYTISDINKILNDIFRKLNISSESEHRTLEIIKSYFDVEERLENAGLFYAIRGIKVVNEVATFTWKFEEWANKKFEENAVISNTEITRKINELRSKLPILGMYKLESRNAIKLVHDYFDFQRVGVKKIKGGNEYLYKFASMYPKEIEGYEIQPLRKIDISDKHYEDMTEEELIQCQLKDSSEDLNYYMNMTKEFEMF